MKRTIEIFESWKHQCAIPFNIVFNIEIPKSDFDQIIKEVEALQEEVMYLRKMKNRYQKRLIEKGEIIFENDELNI